jgi:hypothetical protein
LILAVEEAVLADESVLALKGAVMLRELKLNELVLSELVFSEVRLAPSFSSESVKAFVSSSIGLPDAVDDPATVGRTLFEAS